MAERSLKLETIQRILEVTLPFGYGSVGLYACKEWGRGPRTEEDWRVVEGWSKGTNRYKAAALYAYGPTKAPMDLIREVLESGLGDYTRAALYAAQGKSFEKGLILDALWEIKKMQPSLSNLGDLPEKMRISISEISDWLNCSPPAKRLAVLASANKNVPLKWLFEALDDEDYFVRMAAVDVLRKKNVSTQVLRRYWDKYRSPGWYRSYLCMLEICAGRDNAKNIICEGIHSNVEIAAKACQGVNFSLSEIDKWRNSAYSFEREAAMYASIDRLDVPDAWVKELLSDNSLYVRRAAGLACKGRKFLPIRDFEPPEHVYKKCLNNVVVTAKIPADAEIRGNFRGTARANKALIMDVEGDFYGENVGVSIYDQQVLYHVGDEVLVPDFNMSEKKYSTGFYFCPCREDLRYY